MTAQPSVRRKRTYKELFLDKLKRLSGAEQKLINNGTLQKSLGWNEERYKRIKAELVADKAVIAGVGGPGGAVGLAEVPGSKAPSSP